MNSLRPLRTARIARSHRHARVVKREDVDRFAVNTPARRKARESGSFRKSVIPVKDRNGSTVLAEDEFIRPDTTVDGLAKLSPSFEVIGEMGGFNAVALQKYHWVERIEHVHTAGNSSGIVDGASLALIGSARVGAELGLTPRARIVAAAVSGADPTIMLTGPMPATRKALYRKASPRTRSTLRGKRSLRRRAYALHARHGDSA